jgi:hypothetical protein
MRLIISILLLSISLSSIAQHTKRKDTLQSPRMDLDKLQRQIDSTHKMLETLGNASFKRIQDEEFKRSLEQNNRNLDAFMAARREQEKKQIRQMWIRLFMGVFILAFGIFAILRRIKKLKP